MGFVKTSVTRDTAGMSEDLSGVLSKDLQNSFAICKGPDKLRELLNNIMPGHTTHYVSNGAWSMHDLVTELLKKYRPAELFISTYAIRETPVRQLVIALDRGDVTSVKMILDYRAKVRTPEVFQLAERNMNQIYLTSIHAKVCVLRTPQAMITILGSSNWTKNPKIEAGTVTLDKSIGNFHINWMEQVMQNAKIFA